MSHIIQDERAIISTPCWWNFISRAHLHVREQMKIIVVTCNVHTSRNVNKNKTTDSNENTTTYADVSFILTTTWGYIAIFAALLARSTLPCCYSRRFRSSAQFGISSLVVSQQLWTWLQTIEEAQVSLHVPIASSLQLHALCEET